MDFFKRISRYRHYVKVPLSGLRIIFGSRTLEESLRKNQNVGKLLIIGMARTGTSLLQRLLNAYPGVFVTYESIYGPFLGNNSQKDIHAYYYEILKQHKHLCLALHPTLPDTSFKPFSFEQEFHFFGDKVIYHPSRRFQRYLKQVFHSEKADKIIFIVRDPRARISSYLKWIHHRNSTYRYTASDWIKQNKLDHQQLVITESRKWNEFVTDVLNYTSAYSRCIFIKYEDLVETPVSSMEQILTFLTLDPDLFPDHYLDTIKSHSVDRWRGELDPFTIAQVTEITQFYLDKLQYINPVE